MRASALRSASAWEQEQLAATHLVRLQRSQIKWGSLGSTETAVLHIYQSDPNACIHVIDMTAALWVCMSLTLSIFRVKSATYKWDIEKPRTPVSACLCNNRRMSLRRHAFGVARPSVVGAAVGQAGWKLWQSPGCWGLEPKHLKAAAGVSFG